MAQFHIRIAGRVAAVCSLFESTRDYCRDYLTQDPPDFSLTVTREDLETEQRLLYEEALAEGLRPRVFPDPFLERSSIQRMLAHRLLDYDILLFHGSAVAVDGKGYLFTAGCGTGKSTHTRLWRQVFGHRAVMVNDDKPFLLFTPTQVLVCGSPWSGKHGLGSNITVPLKGICILERGTENRIQKAAPERAAFLHTQICRPEDAQRLEKCLALTDALAAGVPLWHMTCTMDPQAAVVAHEAMSQA